MTGHYMNSFVKAFLCLFVCVGVATGAMAAERPVQKRWSDNATSGKATAVGEFSDFGKNCKLYRMPKVRILQQPKFGRAVLRRENIFPKVGKKDARARCEGKRIPGIKVYYTSQVGFRGSDRLKVRAVFASAIWETTITVDVR